MSTNLERFELGGVWSPESVRSWGRELSVDVDELLANHDGRQIELRTTSTHAQWRYVGDATWQDLFALSDLKGEKGETGGHLVHHQESASATWLITHELDFKPNVTVVNSAGDTVHGHIVHHSDQALTLTFSAAFAGVAYLS